MDIKQAKEVEKQLNSDVKNKDINQGFKDFHKLPQPVTKELSYSFYTKDDLKNQFKQQLKSEQKKYKKSHDTEQKEASQLGVDDAKDGLSDIKHFNHSKHFFSDNYFGPGAHPVTSKGIDYLNHQLHSLIAINQAHHSPQLHSYGHLIHQQSLDAKHQLKHGVKNYDKLFNKDRSAMLQAGLIPGSHFIKLAKEDVKRFKPTKKDLNTLKKNPIAFETKEKVNNYKLDKKTIDKNDQHSLYGIPPVNLDMEAYTDGVNGHRALCAYNDFHVNNKQASKIINSRADSWTKMGTQDFSAYTEMADLNRQEAEYKPKVPLYTKWSKDINHYSFDPDKMDKEYQTQIAKPSYQKQHHESVFPHFSKQKPTTKVTKPLKYGRQNKSSKSLLIKASRNRNGQNRN